MQKIKLAGLSFSAEVIAVLAAAVASVISFGSIVVLYASASGELQSVVAKLRAPAASAAVVQKTASRPKPG